MCSIIAYMYLVEHKAVLFSVSSTIISAVHHFNTVMATPTACWARISGSGYAIAELCLLEDSFT